MLSYISKYKEEEVRIMDYISIIIDALVSFANSFDINGVASAYAGINWNGIKEAAISIFEMFEKIFA